MQPLPQTHSLHICSSHQGLMSDVIAYTLVQSQDIKPVSHKFGHSSKVWLPHELLHGKARLEQVGLLIPQVLQGRTLKDQMLLIPNLPRIAGCAQTQMPINSSPATAIAAQRIHCKPMTPCPEPQQLTQPPS